MTEVGTGASGQARRTAFQMREQVERGRRLDMALQSSVRGLDDRDRAFAHELAYGVTRLRGRIDHLLARHVHRGLDSLDPRLLEALRLGSYQLLYMDSVPDYAAVSETVDHVRSLAGRGAGGMANAVLRKVADAGDGRENFPDPKADPGEFLATWGSHPRWLIDRWMKRWKPAEVLALVKKNNTRPGIFLAPLASTAAEAVAKLAAAGIEGEATGLGECVRLAQGTKPVDALAAVPAAIIQDPAANLVARYASVPAGTNVADLCAAPGGKVLVAARGADHTLAADPSEQRIRMVRENAQRTGSTLDCVVADARHPPITGADVVLLDVPCTGTGTLGRHPDARWRLGADSIAELAKLQRELLLAAAPLVPVGGLLVYSTCTLEPEENHDQVERFLMGAGDFEVEAPKGIHPEFLDGRGYLVVHPDQTGHDGAFAARLRRTG